MTAQLSGIHISVCRLGAVAKGLAQAQSACWQWACHAPQLAVRRHAAAERAESSTLGTKAGAGEWGAAQEARLSAGHLPPVHLPLSPKAAKTTSNY